jgi:hypothetical protein
MANQPSGYRASDCLLAAHAIEADIQRLASDLTEAQFHAPSLTGGWSVAYCIEHLILTGHAFLLKWEQALKDAAARQLYGTGPFPYRWWYRIILGALQPPYTIKTKTTWPLTPCSRQSIDGTLRHFSTMHRALTRSIGLSVGVDAGRARVQSPFVSWIWYPLGFSFDLALTHERRHVWQAWQVRQQFKNEERY